LREVWSDAEAVELVVVVVAKGQMRLLVAEDANEGMKGNENKKPSAVLLLLRTRCAAQSLWRRPGHSLDELLEKVTERMQKAAQVEAV
jgi:hypothetical protein